MGRVLLSLPARCDGLCWSSARWGRMLRGPGEGIAWGQGMWDPAAAGGRRVLTAQQGQGHQHRWLWIPLSPVLLPWRGVTPCHPQPTVGLGEPANSPGLYFQGGKPRFPALLPLHVTSTIPAFAAHSPSPGPWGPAVAGWQRLGDFPCFPRVLAASPAMPNSPSGIECGICGYCQLGCTQIPS